MTMSDPAPLLHGTLDLIVLQLLAGEPTNGYHLAQRIEAATHEVLHVNSGSLYPALYRLEERGLIRARWKPSPTGRRAKVYSVTAAGRKQLAEQRTAWKRFAGAIGAILRQA